MRYSLAAVLALASSVLAQDATSGFAVISKPTKDEKVPAGKTYEVTWAPNPQWPGAVTIEIIAGPTNTTLQLVKPPIATGVDGDKGTYEWAVAPTLGDQAVYGLKISLESNSSVFQYSLPFQITAGSTDGPKDNSTFTRSSSSSSSTMASLSSSSTTEASQTTREATTTTTGSTRPTRTPTTTTASANAVAPTIGSTLALFGGLAMALFAL